MSPEPNARCTDDAADAARVAEVASKHLDPRPGYVSRALKKPKKLGFVSKAKPPSAKTNIAKPVKAPKEKQQIVKPVKAPKETVAPKALSMTKKCVQSRAYEAKLRRMLVSLMRGNVRKERLRFARQV